MENIDYLIVGGGIAGTAGAETIRRRDKQGSIAIVSDEPYRLYSRILLSKPNFFLEKTPFEQIWLKKESWYEENDIKLIAGKKAVKLEPKSKSVFLQGGVELSYKKLLLAIGCCCRRLNIPGIEKSGALFLRDLDDAKAIIRQVKKTKQAVVIGGGFIGFEMADMLKLADIDVTLVIREKYFWESLLDEPSGKMIEKALKKGGVRIIRNSEAGEIRGEDSVQSVLLKDGTDIPCQMVVLGIGVFCPHGWLREAGIEVNRGIIANEYLETNLPDAWTAGDASEYQDVILEERVQLGNWVNAQQQGKAAGLNMTGEKQPFRMVSFYTTQGFGITVGFVGNVYPDSGKKIIKRGSPRLNSYGRLIAKDGELVGATLINRTQEIGPISKIIERDVDISGIKEISDPKFNLSDIL